MEQKMIAKGRPASSGIAYGEIIVLSSSEKLAEVKEGSIIVVKASHPVWVTGMLKSSALISEFGGIISHVAIIAREMGIPCIVAVENATTIFKDGQKVKVDGGKGLIYDA